MSLTDGEKNYKIKRLDIKKELKWLSKFSDKEVEGLIGIGFCKPRNWEPRDWVKAERVIQIACYYDWAYPHDFGHGKGKYSTELKVDTVVKNVISLKKGTR